jgi:hypothetical protein
MAIQGKSLNEFKVGLAKFAKGIDVSVATVHKKIVFEAYTRIIQRSPVDTGRFRASWTIHESTPDTAVKPPGKYSAPTPPQLTFKSSYTIVWINNSLPYALRLEQGWSKQAPQGMVALTELDLTAMVNSMLARIGV